MLLDVLCEFGVVVDGIGLLFWVYGNGLFVGGIVVIDVLVFL